MEKSKDPMEEIDNFVRLNAFVLACLSESEPLTELEVVDRCAGKLASELTVAKTLERLVARGWAKRVSVRDKAGYWRDGYMKVGRKHYFWERD